MLEHSNRRIDNYTRYTQGRPDINLRNYCGRARHLLLYPKVGDQLSSTENMAQERQHTSFLRDLPQGKYEQEMRLLHFFDKVEAVHTLITQPQHQEMLRELGYRIRDFETAYTEMVRYQEEACQQEPSEQKKRIDEFETMSKPLFEICNALQQAASYHGILELACQELLEQSNLEPTGHTEIGSRSQTVESHLEVPSLKELANRDWEEVKKICRKLEEIDGQIDKLSEDLVIYERIGNAFTKIQAKVSEQLAENESNGNDITEAESDFNRDNYDKHIERLYSQFTPEIFGDIGTKQEDTSKPSPSNSSDNNQGIETQESDTGASNTTRLSLESIPSAYLEKEQIKIRFKLQANETMRTKLEQDMEKAKQDKEDLIQRLKEFSTNHHHSEGELESDSPIDSTDQQITELRTRVNNLKEQTFNAIKEHESILDSLQKIYKEKSNAKKSRITDNDTTEHLLLIFNSMQWNLYEKEKAAINTVYEFMTNLATAEKQLDQRKKQSTRQESQPSASLEDTQPTEAQIKLWDLSISLYRNKLIVDHLNRKLSQNEGHLDLLLRERQQLADDPGITEKDSIGIQKLKILEWRNMFLTHESKLLDIIYDPKFNEDTNQFKNLFDALGKNLLPRDLRKIEAKIMSLDKIEDGLQKARTLFVKILDSARDLRKSSSIQEEEYKKDVNKLIDSSQETLDKIDESLHHIADLKSRVQEALETLRTEKLVKAEEQLKNFMESLRPEQKDHPFFPWYIRMPCTTDKFTYRSKLPESCVLSIIKTLMDYLGKDPKRISDLQIAGILRLRWDGARIADIPRALQSLNVRENYRPVWLNTMEELEDILERGKLPVATSLSKKDVGGHAILVVGISEEDDLQFVGALDYTYSYKLFTEDFQKVWVHRSVGPAKALDTWQSEQAERAEGQIEASYLKKQITY